MDGSVQPKRAVALQNSLQLAANHLIFSKGDRIVILSESDNGVFVGCFSDSVGLLPASHIRILEDSEESDFVLPPADQLRALLSSWSANGTKASEIPLTQRQIAEKQLASSGWRVADEPTELKGEDSSTSNMNADGTPRRDELTETNIDEYGFELDDEHGSDNAKISAEKYRERTLKWKKMLEPPPQFAHIPLSEQGLANWNKFFRNNKAKVIERCQKGIPRPMRGPAWYALSGAASTKAKANNKDFRQYIQKDSKLEILNVIDRDIDRCYPTHIAFRNHGSSAQNDLQDVLKAYSFFDPVIGYCQGMGMVAGMMLMHMTAEDSFWLLAATLSSEKYALNFYDASLSQVKRIATVFDSLLHGHLPKLAAHLDRNNLEPLMYITPWFMALYTTTLPWATVLRIWDMFYCEGVRVLLQFALAIMMVHSDEILTKCPTMQELLPFLLHIPLAKLQPNVLIPVARSIRFRESELTALHEDVNQVVLRKTAKRRF